MNEEYVIPLVNVISPADARDYVAKATAKDFPDEYELDELPVKNQKQVGSCVAFSASEMVEYVNRWQEGKYVQMSTGYIYGNREYETNKLSGGYYARLAMKVLKNRGDCSYESFPHNVKMPKAEELYLNRDKSIDEEAYKNRITTYYRINSRSAVKASLLEGYPIMCTLTWGSGTEYSKEDGMVHFSSKTDGGHCVIIVGWNDKGWIIQNSWGKNWGNKGRAIIPYNAPINELWGITDTFVNGITIKQPNAFVRFCRKVWYFILDCLAN